MSRGVLDPSVLGGLSDRLGDATVSKLVRLFRENVEQRQLEARRAFEAGDESAVAVAFHSIKGSAQLVGARDLERLAARWEQQARDGLPQSVDRALSELERAYQKVVEKLEGRG